MSVPAETAEFVVLDAYPEIPPFLNEHVFASLTEAREIIEAWRVDYKANRPHSSLGNRTPEEFGRDLINSLPSALTAHALNGATLF